MALALAGVLAVGCGRRAEAPDAGAPVDAGVVVEVEADAAPPRRPRRSAVALPSGESAWGVAIPFGCTPVFARVEWVEARCRLSYEGLRRFFAFRFPAGRSTRLARGTRFEPGTTAAGHAVLTPFSADGGVRSRLMIFAGPTIDDGARALIERLTPAALRGE